ncbi:MAG TPA: hypothetical protein VFX51_24360 [Solirubrobacteraceae bacterium]|nr:hypothetical protein [Solirubrobacteraceae bacterium]
MTHTSLFRRLFIGAAVLLVPLAGAATAQAGEAARCEGRVIEQPFTAWEDPLDYFLAPDGDFSNGAAGWQLDGADVTADNEPWNVHGSETAAAVRIPSGASATSPFICVGVDDPTMRFFARSSADAGRTLDVEVLYTDGDGNEQALQIGSISGESALDWTPVAPLPITANEYEMTVAFRFTARGPDSEWLIDDVYIDPYRKG